jgi:hypothetical protein
MTSCKIIFVAVMACAVLARPMYNIKMWNEDVRSTDGLQANQRRDVIDAAMADLDESMIPASELSARDSAELDVDDGLDKRDLDAAEMDIDEYVQRRRVDEDGSLQGRYIRVDAIDSMAPEALPVVPIMRRGNIDHHPVDEAGTKASALTIAEQMAKIDDVRAAQRSQFREQRLAEGKQRAEITKARHQQKFGVTAADRVVGRQRKLEEIEALHDIKNVGNQNKAQLQGEKMREKGVLADLKSSGNGNKVLGHHNRIGGVIHPLGRDDKFTANRFTKVPGHAVGSAQA